MKIKNLKLMPVVGQSASTQIGKMATAINAAAVVVRSFEEHKFLMLQDPYKPEQSGSGMMWWNGDYSHLWHEYLTEDPIYWAKKYNEHPRYGDQGFIIDRVEHKQIQEVIENKRDLCKFTKHPSPKDAKIIIFAGKNRKPWLNLNHPDIIDYWL